MMKIKISREADKALLQCPKQECNAEERAERGVLIVLILY